MAQSRCDYIKDIATIYQYGLNEAIMKTGE